uniref:protein-tyrosine-phosphatase n=1 Tax=Anopheles merus TaxID=30066 RepID=A0A182VPG7_ANOME
MMTQSRYTVYDANGVSMLRIEPVRAGRDDAPYECVAENGVGDAVSAEATLTVYEGDKTPAGFPVIKQFPTIRVIETGHTAVMQCKATGSPPPKIYWLKDMKRVDMTNPRYSINSEDVAAELKEISHTLCPKRWQTRAPRSLQIDNSEESDMGKYECVAENSIGTEHTKPTPLYVKVRRVPPTFSRPPEPVYEVMLGANLTLTCVAVGSPMPSVKWRKGVDQDLTPENDVPVGRNVLELTDIRVSTNYTCIAQSSLGVIEATSLVKVQCVPSQPSNFRATDVGETAVTLQWSRPTHSGENIVHYELYWNDTYANEQHHQRIPNTETYTLSSLYPDTLYYFWLSARSQRGEGATTPPIPVRTKQYGK